jgi:hypothetical protein
MNTRITKVGTKQWRRSLVSSSDKVDVHNASIIDLQGCMNQMASFPGLLCCVCIHCTVNLSKSNDVKDMGALFCLSGGNRAGFKHEVHDGGDHELYLEQHRHHPTRLQVYSTFTRQEDFLIGEARDLHTARAHVAVGSCRFSRNSRIGSSRPLNA